MLSLFIRGGQFMWIHLILILVILYLTVKKIIDLYVSKNSTPERLKRGVHAILFWGAFSAVLGFYAHFTGMYMAMETITKANDLSPAIMAEGYGISLITILTGLFTLLVSAVIWFFFRGQVEKKLAGLN